MNVEAFVAQLSQISMQCVGQIKADVNTYVGEELPFKNDSIVTSQLFVILVALQIESMKNERTFNFEQIEEYLHNYLLHSEFDSTFRTAVEYYLDIIKEERTHNFLPLSGVAMAFLKRVVEKKALDRVRDRFIYKNGMMNPLFMHALVDIFAKLAGLSTIARQQAIKKEE